MVKEIIATGWGSDAWAQQMEALIESQGSTAVPLRVQSQLFQDHVNALASTAHDQGDENAAFDIWWIGSSITIIHRDASESSRVEAEKFSIEASLTSDVRWQNKRFRRAIRELRKLEQRYFGESCDWLSFWDNLRSRM